MTITEALAEIKTLGKRTTKKRESIAMYLARQERFKDPMEKEGGSVEFIKRERQAIADLEARIIVLRLAIQRANETTTLSVQGDVRTIAAWLVWRRDVAPGRTSFFTAVRAGIQNVRREAQQKGLNVLSGDVKAGTDTDIYINLNERDLVEETEKHEQILGDLDGQLSLKNATVQVEGVA